jgi:hypothetical protein
MNKYQFLYYYQDDIMTLTREEVTEDGVRVYTLFNGNKLYTFEEAKEAARRAKIHNSEKQKTRIRRRVGPRGPSIGFTIEADTDEEALQAVIEIIFEDAEEIHLI